MPSYTNTGRKRRTLLFLLSCVFLTLSICIPSRPDLVEYNNLKRSNPTHNLQNAFNVAEQKLGVTKLLDPEGERLIHRQLNAYELLMWWEKKHQSCLFLSCLFPCCADVFTENPDEKSIITYVVAFYHYFSKMKQLAVEGKRVGKVGGSRTAALRSSFVSFTCFLRSWIRPSRRRR